QRVRVYGTFGTQKICVLDDVLRSLQVTEEEPLPIGCHRRRLELEVTLLTTARDTRVDEGPPIERVGEGGGPAVIPQRLDRQDLLLRDRGNGTKACRRIG